MQGTSARSEMVLVAPSERSLGGVDDDATGPDPMHLLGRRNVPLCRYGIVKPHFKMRFGQFGS